MALAGYTTAGKSSLLNAITGAGVLVDDALFATLDPTVRRTRTPGGREYTLADTVGFVRHLPHHLVEAFRSTLAEVIEGDVIVHVVDASDDDVAGQMSAVRAVLSEIGAGDVREVVVLNKTDLIDDLALTVLRAREPDAVVVSAATGAGIDGLLAAIEQALPRSAEEVDVLVPFTRGDLLARAHRDGDVLSETHDEHGTQLHAMVEPDLAHALRAASTT